MSTSYIFTNTFAAGPLFTYAAAGDHLVIAPNVTAGATSGAALGGLGLDSISLTVMGTLVTTVGLSFTGTDSVIQIAAGGSFVGTNQVSGNAGINLAASRGHTLVNDGSIVATTSIGVLMQGGNEAINNGTISGSSAVFMGLFGGSGDSLINSGRIFANSFDDASNNTRYNNAVYSEGGNTLVTNLASGILAAVSTEGAGVRFGEVAGGSILRNFGEITSQQDYGVNLSTVYSGQLLIRVLNWGTITGFDGSYSGSVNTDILINRGLMDGDVDMGTGNDTFDNRGGYVSGTILGGAGDDRFIMNALEAEEIIGGLNLDSVDFRFGPAVILALDGSFDSGGAAALDTISEVERIIGSRAGNDRIRGDGLNNQLIGLGGNDRLDGAAGADLIQGGSGTDTLTGGLGNDIFRFVALGDAGDVISDFRNVAGNDDRFQVLASAFGGGLVAGALAAANFQSRADNLAQDATDRFIFRTTDHTLWFDVDGTGAGAAIMLADLQAGAVVTAGDIFLI